jgi:hypothetical protein
MSQDDVWCNHLGYALFQTQLRSSSAKFPTNATCKDPGHRTMIICLCNCILHNVNNLAPESDINVVRVRDGRCTRRARDSSFARSVRVLTMHRSETASSRRTVYVVFQRYCQLRLAR